MKLEITTYVCDVCLIAFNWGKSSSWYGSLKMMENNPKEIKHFCSKECADKFKPNKKQNTAISVNVTK